MYPPSPPPGPRRSRLSDLLRPALGLCGKQTVYSCGCICYPSTLMSLSTNRACFITVMSLVLAAHGQTKPPESTDLSKNPKFWLYRRRCLPCGGRVSAPIPIFSPDPEYSEDDHKAKLQGICVLWLIVGPDGKPRDIRVARTPLGHGLDEKAMEAVKKWRFKPAYKDGKPVAVQINVEVNFHLNGAAGIKSDLDSAIARLHQRLSNSSRRIRLPTGVAARQST